MLTLTENAASIIEQLVTRADQGSQGGIRIEKDAQQASGMEVQFAGAPKPGDEVVERQGARVYLDASSAAALSEKELDAAVLDGSVRFSIRERD